MNVILSCSHCGYRDKFTIVTYALWGLKYRKALEENHVIPDAYPCPECILGQVTVSKGK